jgi:hypothetical protein
LSSVSIHTTCTRDVDDVPGLAILDAEIRRRSPNNLERRGRVQIDNGVPLLVGHLVDYTVPCVARIVDDDVDLAVAEFGGLLDERLDVGVVEDVAADCDGLAAILLDAVDYGFRLLCAVLALILRQHSS